MSGTVLDHWRQAWVDVLLSALAAGLSWWLATTLIGDRTPVFAPIAAVIGLSPGVASRRRQTLGMLAGVAVGIFVGGVAHRIDVDPLWTVSGATLVSMLLATSFGLEAVMVIQAGASALVVVGSAVSGTASTRLEDACVGALVALVFSQALFSADAVRILEEAVAALAELATKVAALPPAERRSLLPDVLAATRRLADALTLTGDARRWTLAGYWGRERLVTAERTWRSPGLDLASSLLRLCGDDVDGQPTTLEADVARVQAARHAARP